MEAPPEAWAVETSKDGERWRFYGKAWKWPDEAVLLRSEEHTSELQSHA